VRERGERERREGGRAREERMEECDLFINITDACGVEGSHLLLAGTLEVPISIFGCNDSSVPVTSSYAFVVPAGTCLVLAALSLSLSLSLSFSLPLSHSPLLPFSLPLPFFLSSVRLLSPSLLLSFYPALPSSSLLLPPSPSSSLSPPLVTSLLIESRVGSIATNQCTSVSCRS
jgi:hypothetical protein